MAAATRRAKHAHTATAETRSAETAAAADTRETSALAVASLLRLLSDPTRLRIFALLREGEACVCELASALGLAENLVSHHLGALRRAGLVHDRRDPSDARWVYYTLDAAELDRAHAAVSALFDPRTLGARVPTCGPAAVCGPDSCGSAGCDGGQN
jgi:DNA-binding transcriptional ArsR family regulator